MKVVAAENFADETDFWQSVCLGFLGVKRPDLRNVQVAEIPGVLSLCELPTILSNLSKVVPGKRYLGY